MRKPATCTYCGLPVLVRNPSAAVAPLYCCYGCHLAAEITGKQGDAGHTQWMLMRLGAGIALSMAVMMFSLPTYSPDIYGAEQGATEFSIHWTSLLRFLSLGLSLPVLYLLGGPILMNAIDEARSGRLTTDALVVVGVAAALVYSYVSTLSNSGGVYFETACTILVLVTLGRFLEASAKLRAALAVKTLRQLLPDDVVVTRDGTQNTIRLADVRKNDLVHCGPGQTLVVDGLIIDGRAHLDEHLVTGESTPKVREVGDLVNAGTINLDGVLLVRADGVGDENTVGRITNLLEQAKFAKGHYGRMADRISALFIPIVTLLAVLGAVVTWQQSRATDGLMLGLAVLLVSCPCALGIATPLAVWTALGEAARHGVLFKNAEAIEKLAVAQGVAFDKTGTLTSGDPRVTRFECANDDSASNAKWLALSAGLGGASRHVLSGAIMAYAHENRIQPAAVSQVRAIAGRGVEGRMNGAVARLGSPRMMEELAIQVPQALQTILSQAMARAQSVACLSWNDAAVGAFEFVEELRTESTAALTRIRSMGMDVCILSGDHAQRAAALGQVFGVDAHANMTPSDKLDFLGAWRERIGAVAMVGDGINDAPALVGADVGMALGCGADISRDAADVCLLGNDLRLVPYAIELARRTLRTIKQNLFWAFTCNMVGIPLALTGKLSPTFAAIAMVVSSLVVAANSSRIGRNISEPLS